jgi:hypothetical protein
MTALKDVQLEIIAICDGLLMEAEDLISEELNLIAVDLMHRVADAKSASELVNAVETADAELEQLGGFEDTIEALRTAAGRI